MYFSLRLSNLSIQVFLDFQRSNKSFQQDVSMAMLQRDREMEMDVAAIKANYVGSPCQIIAVPRENYSF